MADHLWLLILLLSLCTITVLGNVFVSIDCGASGSFTDENSIVWKGDGDLISNGVTHVVQSNYSISHVMDTLRVFTTRKKNCYSIEAEEGGKVLVRASFNYGNYDQKSNPPIFDLHFDGNFWITVNTSQVKIYEAIYVVKRKSISICVAQTRPNNFPFISALEVRSVDSQVNRYVDTNYALLMNARVAYATNETIRFPADSYDRIWLPSPGGNGLLNMKSDASVINVGVPNNPPQEVLKHAIMVPNTSQMITLGLPTIDYPIRYPLYINWYFSEIQEVNSTNIRSFRVLENGLPFSLAIVPPFGNVTVYFISNITVTPDTNFSLDPIGATLPPLINAAEVYSISDALTNGTNNNDVEGLVSLQKAFGVLQEWGGDPCLPAPYSWEWINCNDDATPRVTSLNLTGFNLSGPLPDFRNMDALEIIDFHNNSLTGPIPDFIGNLPNLKQLYLADNQFSGSIPRSLTTNSNLTLSLTENPLLCTNAKSCPGNNKNKKQTSKLPVILGITIPVFFIVAAIIGLLVIKHNRRIPHTGDSRSINGPSSTRGTMPDGNVDDESANELRGNKEERFYASPSPLLAEG